MHDNVKLFYTIIHPIITLQIHYIIRMSIYIWKWGISKAIVTCGACGAEICLHEVEMEEKKVPSRMD